MTTLTQYSVLHTTTHYALSTMVETAGLKLFSVTERISIKKGLAGFLVRMTDIVEVQLFELKLIL